MRRISAVAVLMALISVLTGAASAGAQGASGEDEKLVLRIGDTNDIDGFNPFKLVEIPSFEVMDLTYDLLVDFSPKDSSPVPGLDDSWEHSKDGLTWTFHLNKDATWQDGKPVTSEDVAYTFRRILDEEQGLFIDYVKQIDKIETPDKHTVVFTTKDPSVQMLSMYVYILPKHIWKDVPPDETKTFPNEPAVGSGPFQAVEWKKGQYARLKVNPDYFRGAPKLDEIIFQFYDNDDTMVQALKNGDVDYISGIPINLFKSLKNQEGIETNSAPDPWFTELGFNLYEPSPEVIDEFDAPKTRPCWTPGCGRRSTGPSTKMRSLRRYSRARASPVPRSSPRCSPSTTWSWANPSCRASISSAPRSCWSRPDGRTPTATGSWTRTVRI
jgi:peptide/nickel transport system substrate-binding protein